MAGVQLVETAIDLIETQLKNNIGTALANIRTQRADAAVSTEAPRDYFIYPRAKAYRTPAVFIIADEIDFRKEQLGANHVNAINHINVSVVIEDKDAEKLTIKAYRYQAALFACLDQVPLISADEQVKITVVVKNASFSPLYSNMDSPDAPEAVFRKEVALKLDVYHYENYI